MTLTNSEIAKMTDYAVLQPGLSTDEIYLELEKAGELGAYSVCVNSSNVAIAVDAMTDFPNTKVCAVIGFPHGTQSVDVKEFETLEAINNGATEIDYVMNATLAKDALQDGDFDWLEIEALKISRAAQSKDNTVVIKVIFEVHYFNLDEIATLTKFFSNIPEIGYVKTSTGFAGSGATVETIETMLANVSHGTLVKASGGVGKRDIVEKFCEMGVSRFGMSKLGEVLNGDEKASY